jgi:hypothetical protein
MHLNTQQAMFQHFFKCNLLYANSLFVSHISYLRIAYNEVRLYLITLKIQFAHMGENKSKIATKYMQNSVKLK